MADTLGTTSGVISGNWIRPTAHGLFLSHTINRSHFILVSSSSYPLLLISSKRGFWPFGFHFNFHAHLFAGPVLRTAHLRKAYCFFAHGNSRLAGPAGWWETHCITTKDLAGSKA